MIQYNKFLLPNGLTVIVHEEHSTPLVTVNMLCGVGARNENPEKTGFAHLFEHLMFGGTVQYPDYDKVVASMGGDSNAFTNNDYTNYYLTVPAYHLEDALRLESDRLMGINISEESLRVQQQVVTEEYNQRYMNRPYGDVYLLLRPLCYIRHPYRWCTIGSDIKHVQEATLDDVRHFFDRYYSIDNIILSVAGDIHTDEAMELINKYFGSIKPVNAVPLYDELPLVEPVQTQARTCTVHRPVPADAIYKAYVMADHTSLDYYVFDLLSDVLSNGNSSRLYNKYVKEKPLFADINAYITGEQSNGLFLVSARPASGVSIAEAERIIDEELRLLSQQPVSPSELEKVVNKFECNFAYSQYKVADRAFSLCHYEWLGNLDWVNDEPLEYRKVTSGDLQRVASSTFVPEKSNTLYYLKNE